MYHCEIKIEDKLKEEKEHTKRYTSKANNFSNFKAWKRDDFVNRIEQKGKYGAAKRMKLQRR
jgi:hypothetical protein